MGVFADAGKNIEHLTAVRSRRTARHWSREAGDDNLGQVDQLPVDLFFAANEVPLNFDVDIVAPKRIDQKLCARSAELWGAHAARVRIRRLAANFFVHGSVLSTEFVRRAAERSTRAACAPQEFPRRLDGKRAQRVLRKILRARSRQMRQLPFSLRRCA